MRGTYAIPYGRPSPVDPQFCDTAQNGEAAERLKPEACRVTSSGEAQAAPGTNIQNGQYLVNIRNRFEECVIWTQSVFSEVPEVLFPGQALVLAGTFDACADPFQSQEFTNKQCQQASVRPPMCAYDFAIWRIGARSHMQFPFLNCGDEIWRLYRPLLLAHY